ncbi:SEC-C metal-binding domain-containing protein [Streptomyces sp. NPDC059909]|uniref:SEC-C domain-containing protein n=1 Tax=Streptomyces sp. NPDC059909 TaxID=3346998 RepID=UPI0036573158
MTGPAARHDQTPTSPYDAFLAGLDGGASADAYEQWARDHDSDPDVPRALIHAGWTRSQARDHEGALALFRRALERGGEQSRNAQVGIIEQLYALRRTDEGHAARDALRAELDATTPPDLWIYKEMAELLSEAADPQLRAALQWCEAALARTGAEDVGEDAADYRQSLLFNRSVLREQLGLEPDELDRAVDAAEAEADGELLDLLGQLDGLIDPPATGPFPDEGPFDGVILRWTRADFPEARRRWPKTTTEYGDDYESYAAALQRSALRFSTGGAVRVRMVTGRLADFDAYVRHSGDAPDDPGTRTRYATWRDAEAATETLLWPPARNGPCWCESGRKYKKCCARHEAP